MKYHQPDFAKLIRIVVVELGVELSPGFEIVHSLVGGPDDNFDPCRIELFDVRLQLNLGISPDIALTGSSKIVRGLRDWVTERDLIFTQPAF